MLSPIQAQLVVEDHLSPLLATVADFLGIEMVHQRVDAHLRCLTDHDCPRPTGRPTVAVGVAMMLAATTRLDLTTAADCVANILRRGEHFSARTLRETAAHVGTSLHFGRVSGPGVDWGELQWWARRCPDRPWSGEGDFGAWLGIGAGERDDW